MAFSLRAGLVDQSHPGGVPRILGQARRIRAMVTAIAIVTTAISTILCGSRSVWAA
jgi:hypothetical protein